MALSHLPLAKRKTLVKIFENLKKKYKSSQRFSRTDSFQLMRRVVEYSPKESNFNQAFNNNSNCPYYPCYKNSFCRETEKTTNTFFQEKGNKMLKEKTTKYSQFFSKESKNQSLLRLACFKTQIFDLTDYINAPLVCFTSKDNPNFLSFLLKKIKSTEWKSSLRMYRIESQENDRSKRISFLTKKFSQEIKNNEIIHEIESLYGNNLFVSTQHTDDNKRTLRTEGNTLRTVGKEMVCTLNSKDTTNHTNSFLTFLKRFNDSFSQICKPNTLLFFKLQKYSEINKKKSKSILVNQKIFTYFNHSIYLYFAVGYRQNECDQGASLTVKKQKNTVSPLSLNSTLPFSFNTNSPTYIPLLPHTTHHTYIPSMIPYVPKVKRWYVGMVRYACEIGYISINKVPHAMVPSVPSSRVFKKAIKESVFQKSLIPLLSESDQVTFVTDSNGTVSHQFTLYSQKRSLFSLSPNQISKSSAPFWGIPFFTGYNRFFTPLRILNTLPPIPPKVGTVETVVRKKMEYSNLKGSLHKVRTVLPNGSKVSNSIPKVSVTKHKVPNKIDTCLSSMCHTADNMDDTFTVFPGQLLTYGDPIANNIVTTESGQILYVDSQKTTLRKAQTVLIYSQAIIAVLSGEWIKKGTPLMSLSYQKLVTGDIVQGLPKIEQFFEAPVLKDGTFWSDSLQAKLNQFFQEQREQLPLAEAVRKGFSEIQRVLVEGVQRVYISQGVLIADKHLEVIVRQMTCKGRILYSGDTGFLRNELVSLDKIENVNQVTYGQKALYHPQVRGITDASLESESFLSAASFQETTRVLSRDAIIGKTDLMRGLKERVIVGELIQAGTGLANNSVYNLL